MLSCVPPTREAIENMRCSNYCGASSGYKPAKVISDIAQYKNPAIAITSNSDISSWNTSADIVIDKSLNKVYYLDKAGCITEDTAQAESSMVWAKTKDGHKVMLYQQPYDASQAYQTNDIVEKDGRVYQSSIDNNVWIPDAIESRMAELWTEITRLKAKQAIHSQLIDYVNKGYLPPIYRYDWWEIE